MNVADQMATDAELAARGLIRCPACGCVYERSEETGPKNPCLCRDCGHIYQERPDGTPRPLTAAEKAWLRNHPTREVAKAKQDKVVAPMWG